MTNITITVEDATAENLTALTKKAGRSLEGTIQLALSILEMILDGHPAPSIHDIKSSKSPTPAEP